MWKFTLVSVKNLTTTTNQLCMKFTTDNQKNNFAISVSFQTTHKSLYTDQNAQIFRCDNNTHMTVLTVPTLMQITGSVKVH